MTRSFWGLFLALLSMICAGTYFAQDQSPLPLEFTPTYSGIPLAGLYADARHIERAADVTEGVTMGIDEDNVPYVGDPEAPIAFANVSDFTCSHCVDFSATYDNLIRDFGRNGEAVFYYYPLAAVSRQPASGNAAQAALCAGEQGAFWEMHNEINRLYVVETEAAFTPDRLEAAVIDLGLDGAVLRQCMETYRMDLTRVGTDSLVAEFGINSVPTILYRLKGDETWRTIPLGDEIGGIRSYEELADLIRKANAE